MKRTALEDLEHWWKKSEQSSRKPLVLRGARQVGKSFLVRDFCRRKNLSCAEINLEKTPSLRRLFVEGDNSKTISLLEVHFGKRLDANTLLFIDELQAAPEVFARLRYFCEESPDLAVIAAGSLLEFALAEFEQSIPVGRIEYLHLGPMRFEEFLEAQKEEGLLKLLRKWQLHVPQTTIPEVFHERLLSYARDFSLVGGMPEAVARFIPNRDFQACAEIQRAILETYSQDFAKYRKRIPLERLERVFNAIPAQVGKKWVHARINPNEKALAIEAALESLCKARVAHRVFHSSGNGIPLSAERKNNLYKTLFLDVGLMENQLGLQVTDLIESDSFARVNEGAIAEQWVGQHLLDARPLFQNPELHYWVREKTGALAEVDYLLALGTRVIPIEVKAGASSRVKSLQVFLAEKRNSPFGIQISAEAAFHDQPRKILKLPFYLIEQIPRIAREFLARPPSPL